VTAVSDGIFQVRQVGQELQEPLASLVLLDLLDLLDHLDPTACQAREAHQDHQDKAVLQDLQDFQAAQVCSCHSISVSAVSDRVFHVCNFAVAYLGFYEVGGRGQVPKAQALRHQMRRGVVPLPPRRVICAGCCASPPEFL